MSVTKRKKTESGNKPSTYPALDHDIPVCDESGKIKDLVKRSSDAPRPHADGCVGCRREARCVFCGRPAILNETRCVSGACLDCCASYHAPHEVSFRVVINPKLKFDRPGE